jgi:hypothetical protein
MRVVVTNYQYILGVTGVTNRLHIMPKDYILAPFKPVQSK